MQAHLAHEVSPAGHARRGRAAHQHRGGVGERARTGEARSSVGVALSAKRAISLSDRALERVHALVERHLDQAVGAQRGQLRPSRAKSLQLEELKLVGARVRRDTLQLAQRGGKNDGDVTLPRLRKRREWPSYVHELDELRDAMLVLELDEVGELRPKARFLQPRDPHADVRNSLLEAQQRRNVRVRLADDEVVHVEQLRQRFQRQVLLDAAVLPQAVQPARTQACQFAARVFGNELLAGEEAGQCARRGHGAPHDDVRRGEVVQQTRLLVSPASAKADVENAARLFVRFLEREVAEQRSQHLHERSELLQVPRAPEVAQHQAPRRDAEEAHVPIACKLHDVLHPSAIELLGSSRAYHGAHEAPHGATGEDARQEALAKQRLDDAYVKPTKRAAAAQHERRASKCVPRLLQECELILEADGGAVGSLRRESILLRRRGEVAKLIGRFLDVRLDHLGEQHAVAVLLQLWVVHVAEVARHVRAKREDDVGHVSGGAQSAQALQAILQHLLVVEVQLLPQQLLLAVAVVQPVELLSGGQPLLVALRALHRGDERAAVHHPRAVVVHVHAVRRVSDGRGCGESGYLESVPLAYELPRTWEQAVPHDVPSRTSVVPECFRDRHPRRSS
mmetsp:Transcript_5641/g.14692  ORF Transcript_5641/g.14692 Transcript_5641/m.14692 type:complete len:623 (-) Transcript_5641:500-2368(-)